MNRDNRRGPRRKSGPSPVMLPMPAPSRQTGVSDGPLYFLSARRIPRPWARVTFGRSPKSDQKRCLKPQVSRLPARLGASGNVTVYHAKIRIALIAAQRIACGPLIAAAPTFRAVVRCSVAAQRRFLRCFVVFYIVCNASAGRSCAARGYICSFADVLKFADGPALAPVGACVLGSPHRRTARYRRTFA